MSAASDGSVEGHDGGDDAVDFLGGALFVGFDVASRVGTHVNVIHHPTEGRERLTEPLSGSIPIREARD